MQDYFFGIAEDTFHHIKCLEEQINNTEFGALMCFVSCDEKKQVEMSQSITYN